MSRILLADDSSHAQRMGEYILREEGYEVVSVTDGETALLRLGDVDPDLVLADALMPLRSGYEICEFIKTSPRHRHARVVLTISAHESVNESEAERVHADGVLKRPFEASAMLDLLRPLIQSAEQDRKRNPEIPVMVRALKQVHDTPERVSQELETRSRKSRSLISPDADTGDLPSPERQADAPPVTATTSATASTPAVDAAPAAVEVAPPSPTSTPNAAATSAASEAQVDPKTSSVPEVKPAQATVIEPDRIRAAVTIALDAAMFDMIDKITEKVIIALKPETQR